MLSIGFIHAICMIGMFAAVAISDFSVIWVPGISIVFIICQSFNHVDLSGVYQNAEVIVVASRSEAYDMAMTEPLRYGVIPIVLGNTGASKVIQLHRVGVNISS